MSINSSLVILRSTSWKISHANFCQYTSSICVQQNRVIHRSLSTLSSLPFCKDFTSISIHLGTTLAECDNKKVGFVEQTRKYSVTLSSCQFLPCIMFTKNSIIKITSGNNLTEYLHKKDLQNRPEN